MPKYIGQLICLLILVIGQTHGARGQTTDVGDEIGAITGRVVNENGQPIPNASVFVRGSAPMFQQRTATSDTEGNFRVNGLDPLLYGVSAVAPAYVTPPRDPDTPAPYYRVGDSVTLTLVRGGVIAGTVLNASGEPVVQIGVRAVMIRDTNGKPIPSFPFQAQRSTDDRGMYRLYGLMAGTYVVFTGGRGGFLTTSYPYDGEAPTYAPSATVDSAAEITVRPGEETKGVDIRYRAQPGHTVSGRVLGPFDPQAPNITTINIIQRIESVPVQTATIFQQPNGTGFSAAGIADGEYDIIAQYSTPQGGFLTTEPRHIVVKGADVTGLEIVLKPLGSVEGRVVLVKSQLPECKDKRQPIFSETLINVRRDDKPNEKAQPSLIGFMGSQGIPIKTGEFRLRNLAPGNYKVGTRFFARYWYLRSISIDNAFEPTLSKSASAKRTIDVARNGVSLKFGEQLKDVTVTLAEGAGSLRGQVTRNEGQSFPPKTQVHLVPAEKENADDVLRYFAAPVQPDGTFALNNLPPGRYWVIAKTTPSNEALSGAKATDTLAQLKRDAEAGKNSIEFKPCQNIVGFSLPLP